MTELLIFDIVGEGVRLHEADRGSQVALPVAEVDGVGIGVNVADGMSVLVADGVGRVALWTDTDTSELGDVVSEPSGDVVEDNDNAVVTLLVVEALSCPDKDCVDEGNVETVLDRVFRVELTDTCRDHELSIVVVPMATVVERDEDRLIEMDLTLRVTSFVKERVPVTDLDLSADSEIDVVLDQC